MSEPMMMAYSGHLVPNFDEWLKVYGENQKELHTAWGVQTAIACQLERPDNKHECFVVHFFPKSKFDSVKAALDFSKEPFPTFIKQGVVIEPIRGPYFAEVATDKFQQPGQALTIGDYIVACSHGVPDFPLWHKAFVEHDAAGFHMKLGTKRTIAGRSVENRDNQKAACEVMHTCSPENLGAWKQTLDFRAPPFVGGPDLIKNGLVLLPARKYFAKIARVDYYNQGPVDQCFSFVKSIADSLAKAIGCK